MEEPAVGRGPLEVSVCTAQWRGREVVVVGGGVRDVKFGVKQTDLDRQRSVFSKRLRQLACHSHHSPQLFPAKQLVSE